MKIFLSLPIFFSLSFFAAERMEIESAKRSLSPTEQSSKRTKPTNALSIRLIGKTGSLPPILFDPEERLPLPGNLIRNVASMALLELENAPRKTLELTFPQFSPTELKILSEIISILSETLLAIDNEQDTAAKEELRKNGTDRIFNILHQFHFKKNKDEFDIIDLAAIARELNAQALLPFIYNFIAQSILSIETEKLEQKAFIFERLQQLSTDDIEEIKELITYYANLIFFTKSKKDLKANLSGSIQYQISPGSTYIACDNGRQLNVWNRADFEKPVSINFGTPILSLAFSPNDQYVAVTSDNYGIEIFELAQLPQTKNPKAIYRGRSNISRLQWSPDNRYVAGLNERNEAVIFDLIDIDKPGIKDIYRIKKIVISRPEFARLASRENAEQFTGLIFNDHNQLCDFTNFAIYNLSHLPNPKAMPIEIHENVLIKAAARKPIIFYLDVDAQELASLNLNTLDSSSWLIPDLKDFAISQAGDFVTLYYADNIVVTKATAALFDLNIEKKATFCNFFRQDAVNDKNCCISSNGKIFLAKQNMHNLEIGVLSSVFIDLKNYKNLFNITYSQSKIFPMTDLTQPIAQFSPDSNFCIAQDGSYIEFVRFDSNLTIQELLIDINKRQLAYANLSRFAQEINAQLVTPLIKELNGYASFQNIEINLPSLSHRPQEGAIFAQGKRKVTFDYDHIFGLKIWGNQLRGYHYAFPELSDSIQYTKIIHGPAGFFQATVVIGNIALTPRKTFFPTNWPPALIMGKLIAALKDPGAEFSRDGKNIVIHSYIKTNQDHREILVPVKFILDPANNVIITVHPEID